MKREKIYCLSLAIIATILLWHFTLKYIPSPGIESVVIILMYLELILVIFVSGLSVIKNRKSKEDWFGLFFGVDGLIMIIDSMIGCFGKIDESMTTIVMIIFMITFLLLIILFSLWSKFEKNL